MCDHLSTGWLRPHHEWVTTRSATWSVEDSYWTGKPEVYGVQGRGTAPTKDKVQFLHTWVSSASAIRAGQ